MKTQASEAPHKNRHLMISQSPAAKAPTTTPTSATIPRYHSTSIQSAQSLQSAEEDANLQICRACKAKLLFCLAGQSNAAVLFFGRFFENLLPLPLVTIAMNYKKRSFEACREAFHEKCFLPGLPGILLALAQTTGLFTSFLPASCDMNIFEQTWHILAKHV